MNKAILSLKIDKENSGKTIGIICKHVLGISTGVLRELKKSEKLLLNGKVCRTVDAVRIGDELTADVSENERSEDIKPIDHKLDILYDDSFLTVVNKPRKMSVHPSQGNRENTLANGIIHYWNSKGETHKFHAVNRIDKDTSGICVIAKNRFAHAALQSDCGGFTKKYIAILHGTPHPRHGTITVPIKRSENSVIKRVAAPDGKTAVTHYQTVKTNNLFSMAEISLETGRTHQIRVHMSHIGNPLVGDWLYGDEDKEYNINGHLLHVYYIEFMHPQTKEKMTFNLPLPDDMIQFFPEP